MTSVCVAESSKSPDIMQNVRVTNLSSSD